MMLDARGEPGAGTTMISEEYQPSNRERNAGADRRRWKVSSRGLLTLNPVRPAKLPRAWRRKLRKMR